MAGAQKSLDSIDKEFTEDFKVYRFVDSLIEKSDIISTEKAIDSFLSIDPGNLRLYLSKGDLYTKHGKFSDAIREYSFGVAANYNPVSLERRASVYILQKNYQLALVDLKDAAKLNREYIYSIGYTYELMGELDSAILYYERYQSVSKTNVQSRIDSVRTKMSNN